MSEGNEIVPALTGFLRKMKTALEGETVSYAFAVEGEAPLALNALVGESVRLTFLDELACVGCGRKINKSFQQGYCFPCVQTKAECDLCIVRPERCHYHLGTCREPQWGEQHCMQQHVVYLANASGLKVGITKRVNIPHRFIDQGAVQALPILTVSSRYLSGLIEFELAKVISDKTNWRQMLSGMPVLLDLEAERDRLRPVLEEIITRVGAIHEETVGAVKTEVQFFAAGAEGEVKSLDSCFRRNDSVVQDDSQIRDEISVRAAFTLNYPITAYPLKLQSVNLQKERKMTGVLQGIKGQYWLLPQGVINIRNLAGCRVKLEY